MRETMNEILGRSLAFGSFFNHFQHTTDGTFIGFPYHTEPYNAVSGYHSRHDFLPRFYQSRHRFACQCSRVKGS